MDVRDASPKGTSLTSATDGVSYSSMYQQYSMPGIAPAQLPKPLHATTVQYLQQLTTQLGRSHTHTHAPMSKTRRRCRKLAARCRVAGCSARPWFAQPGARVPKACKGHKEEGEVNIYTPACEADGCRTRPHYGVEGARARFCSTHKVRTVVGAALRHCF